MDKMADRTPTKLIASPNVSGINNPIERQKLSD